MRYLFVLLLTGCSTAAAPLMPPAIIDAEAISQMEKPTPVLAKPQH